ncbi:ExbD/TolR family protein [Jiella mangrovi]|uniref:ExbD/TolR family protein n=1 Tax=Jiella mangrovi TaxID=2821407 RepID=UPI001AE9C629
MLTPLVDVIFLLVIFFALSSRIAPFGLIPVSGHQEAPADREAAAERRASDAQTVLVLSHGTVRAGSRIIALGDLAPAATSMREAGTGSVLVVTSRRALAEDVAQALNALRLAGIGNVRLVGRPSGAATSQTGASP